MNCKLLLTTRCDVTEYNYCQLSVGSLENSFVWDIFRKWYPSKLNEENISAAREIISMYQGHTMAVELLAKQMKASCVVPKRMLEKLRSHGFSDTGKERFIHNKDGFSQKLNIQSHIKRLFDVSGLSEAQVYVLANLSLIPPSGISKEQFHDWCRLESYEEINDLTDAGWIRHEEEREMISLHPIVAEVLQDFLECDSSLCDTMLKTISSFLIKDQPDEWGELLDDQLPYIHYEGLVATVFSILRRISALRSISAIGIALICASSSHLYRFGNRNALLDAGIPFSYIDDFCTGNSNQIKTDAILRQLSKTLENALSLNVHDMLRNAYQATRAEMSDAERKQFYDRYVKKCAL